MQHLSKIILMLLFTGLLFACGDSGNGQAAEKKTVATDIKPENSKQSDKPFAQEQQLIREAGKLQGTLNQDAEEKKKAIKDAN